MKNDPFLEQTAQDYDMSYEEVERIKKNHPGAFYEKLEEFIKIRANSNNEPPNKAKEWWNTLPLFHMDKPCKRLFAARLKKEVGMMTDKEILEVYIKHTNEQDDKEIDEMSHDIESQIQNLK